MTRRSGFEPSSAPVHRHFLEVLLRALVLATTAASGVWWQLAWIPPRFAPEVQGAAVASLADILATVAAVVGAIFLWRRQACGSVPRPLVLAGAVVAGLAWIGIPWSVSPLLAAATALHLLVLLILFFVVASGPATPVHVCLALIATLVVQIPLATLQVTAQSTYPASSLLAWNGDFVPHMSGASVLLRPDGTRWLRPYGPFFHPNILGGYLALELTLLTGLYAATRQRFSLAWQEMIVGVMFGLIVGAVIVTGSRGAWLGAASGIAVVLVGSRLAPRLVDKQDDTPAWSKVIVACATLTALAYVVATRPPLLERFAPMSNSLERRSVELRLQEVMVGSALVASHPLVGVGAGGGQAAAASYLGGAFAPEPVHNVPLLMTVELGPLALLAWVVAATGIVVATLRRRTQWTFVLLAGLVVTAVSGLTDHYWWSDSAARDTVVVLAGSWAAAARSGQAVV